MEKENDMLKEVLHIYGGPLNQLTRNLAGKNGEENLVELKKFNRGEICYNKTDAEKLEGKRTIVLYRHVLENLPDPVIYATIYDSRVTKDNCYFEGMMEIKSKKWNTEKPFGLRYSFLKQGEAIIYEGAFYQGGNDELFRGTWMESLLYIYKLIFASQVWKNLEQNQRDAIRAEAVKLGYVW